MHRPNPYTNPTNPNPTTNPRSPTPTTNQPATPTTLPRHPDEERYFKSGAKSLGGRWGAGSERLPGGEAGRASGRRYAREAGGLRERPRIRRENRARRYDHHTIWIWYRAT